MTQFIADISGFQAGMDLGLLKRQGYAGVIVKCTEGAGYLNGDYARAWRQAQAVGLDFGAYHFLHHGNVQAQAAHLARHVLDRTIPVHVDNELNATLTDLYDFIAACKVYGLRVATNYTPPWYHANLGRPTLPPLPLWVSRYGSNRAGYASVLYPGDRSAEWFGYGGQSVALLQFSSSDKVDGYPRALDVSAYRGTLAQLRSSGLLKPMLPPAPKPPTPPAKPTGNTHPTIPTTPEADVPLSDADVQKVAAAVVEKLLTAPLGEHGPLAGGKPLDVAQALQVSGGYATAQVEAASKLGGAK